jgi:predicted nucleic acid-binding protein
MNVLLDMNVVLDVILSRNPWVAEASQVWDAHEEGRLGAWIAAFSIPTIFYVVRRQNDLVAAHEAVRICRETFEIAPVGRSTLELARQQSGTDYEDALQIASAVEAGVTAIVTRDASGLRQSSVSAISPAELLQQIPSA